MEATVVSVGKSVLDGALSYAKSAVAEEVALQLGVQRDQAFIREELEMMMSFLMAAHEERGENRVLKTWVKQVRDVAYDVEDCLQDFAVHLEKPSRWRIPRTLRERRRIAKQMKELRARVEDVSQRNLRYHLIKDPTSKPATAAAQSISRASATMFGIDEARRFAKQDKPKVDLVQLMNKEDKDLRVIAVWGTGGDVGLTSIIREAYENPNIKGKFPCRAWVRVMHPFNPKMFVQSLVKQFNAPVGVDVMLETEKTERDLAQEFNRYVNAESFLIVLNDLSTIEEWDQIKACFVSNKKGSRIIVSTAQVEVASLCAGQKSRVSELTELSADQTLYVFYEKMRDVEDSEGMSMEAEQDRCDQLATAGPAQGEALDQLPPPQSQAASTASATVAEIMDAEDSEGMSMEALQQLPQHRMGSHDGTDSAKPVSGSNAAITSTNICTVPTGEILDEYVSESVDGKIVLGKSLTRIRTMAAALEESKLIGREKEKHEIIKLISNQTSQQFQVISVWGMGGLGKTTLVKDIYQELKFEKRAWVTIMRPFNTEELLRSIVQQLEAEPSEKKGMVDLLGSPKKKLALMGLEALIKELAKFLERHSCLIVLDDVSSTAEWDQLISPSFREIKNTSWIIVTTREENIAKHCSDQKQENIIYKLKGLEDKDAQDLFTKKVFKKTVDWKGQYRELKEEAELILKKCKGLPLAIVTIGGFLANHRKTALEWRNFNEHISAELKMNPEFGPIRTVLEKSYDGLPYHLKSCFLYLSIFPEDHKVRRRRLVQRWTAEGYSREIRHKSADEIANSYFMELIQRSMILPSQQSVCSRKGIDSCQVHDLIREIGISKSMEENLVFRLEEGCGLNSQSTIRHLTISSSWEGDQSEFERIVDVARIRSLTVFGTRKQFFISDKMRLLRVLDLEGTSGLVDHHIKHIGKLLHLRYISLRGCRLIFHLPDSLGNLRQLQTLDIINTNIINLPKTIIKLRKLQYIRAGIDSAHLEHLPKLFSMAFCGACCAPQLLKRKSQDARGVVLPRGVRKLQALYTMGVVDVARGKAVLQDIKMLTRLRKLQVTGINKKNCQEFCSTLAALSRLENLLVHSEEEPGLSGCLDGMSSPPKNLQTLMLCGNLVKLPEWIKELQNLVKLSLLNTRISELGATIEVLGKLPNLTMLRLWDQSFQGEELRFNFRREAFSSLVGLELHLVDNLKSVEFEEGATPNFELLQFYGRPSETYTGLFSGLQLLPSLKAFMLDNDDYDDDFVEDLRAQLAMNPNPNRPVLKRYDF